MKQFMLFNGAISSIIKRHILYLYRRGSILAVSRLPQTQK
jgi:hypothetical protein